MYVKNKNGPKSDHYGAPHAVDVVAEDISNTEASQNRPFARLHAKMSSWFSHST